MVSRWRAVLVAVALSLSLAAMLAPAAMAAPKAVKPLSVCSSTVTRGMGSINSSYAISDQAGVQELKNSDGTSCYEYRVIGAWRVTPGYSTYHIDWRTAGLYYLPGNSYISGSGAESFSYLTGSSGWQYFYGPWVSISCNTYFHGEFQIEIADGPDAGAAPVAWGYGIYASC
jgi:hypothetical protein